MTQDEITATVVDSAFKIHKRLGPGLFESVYHPILSRDLVRRGLFVESRKPISFDYEECGSRRRSWLICW